MKVGSIYKWRDSLRVHGRLYKFKKVRPDPIFESKVREVIDSLGRERVP